MGIDDLKTYIQKHLQKGYSQTTIASHLAKWGYTQREITEATPHQLFENNPAPHILNKLSGHTLSDALKHTYLLLIVVAISQLTITMLLKDANTNLVGAALSGILSTLLFATQYFLFGLAACLSVHLSTKYLFNQETNYQKLLALFLYSGTPYVLLATIEPTKLYHYLNILSVSVGLFHINLSLMITLLLFISITKQERGLTLLETTTQIAAPIVLFLLFLLTIFFGIAEFRFLSIAFQAF